MHFLHVRISGAFAGCSLQFLENLVSRLKKIEVQYELLEAILKP